MTKNKTLLIAVVAAAAATAAFWFLALSPKREEAASLSTKITAKQSELTTAQQTLAGYKKSKSAYGKNYASVVRLGKAVPEDDDVRSLLVQIDAQAGGAGRRLPHDPGRRAGRRHRRRDRRGRRRPRSSRRAP